MVTRPRSSESGVADGPNGRPEGHKTGSGRPSTNPSWAGLKQAWRAVGKRVPELRDDLSCYAAVQADRARLAVSQVITRVVAGVLLVIAVAAAFAIAAGLMIVGIAGGVASALDGKVWLANLITGAGTLSLLSSAIVIGVRLRRSRRLQRLQRRYEPGPGTRHSRGRSGTAEARNHAERR